MTTPQQQFDAEFITSTEIIDRLSISRSTLTRAVARKQLPEPIRTADGQTTIWRRVEIEPALKEWERVLPTRNFRGEK